MFGYGRSKIKPKWHKFAPLQLPALCPFDAKHTHTIQQRARAFPGARSCIPPGQIRTEGHSIPG
eukprot:m.166716 g.166716  ORF g.166716 m.166716 type:complete len:64 (+) comp15290_c0_seq7:2396-2587(+)